MNAFNVLLLYDHQTRSDYFDLLRSMVGQAGGHLDVVDENHEEFGKTTWEDFVKLESKAEVILIDVSCGNINIGIEVGRRILHLDQRTVLFRTADAPIPHYLKNRPCFELDPSKNSDEEPNRNLEEEIKKIGMRRASLSLTPRPSGPVDGEALKVFGRDQTVVRAPSAAFLFGEFAVMAGHPALYLPLPLYVYTGIRELSRDEDTEVSYLQKPGTLERNPVPTPLDAVYQAELAKAIRLVAPKAPPLKIRVWSQAPTMCGLGTSSALSACIALYLHTKGYITSKLGTEGGEYPSNRNLLAGQSGIAPLFRTAWKLDIAFHGLKGSGAGSFAALAGTSGPNPVLYFSAARKMWCDDIGHYGWQLGEDMAGAHKTIDRIPCWGFRLKPGRRRQAFKNSHFALVFTGEAKSTGLAIAGLRDLSRYFLDSPEMVQQIVKAMKHPPTMLRYELQARRSPSYSKLLARSLAGRTDKVAISGEHAGVSLEALLTAYGMATMVGINSYWSKGDNSFLALMESCQCLLEVLGVTNIPAGRGCFPTWEPHCLAKEINSACGPDGKRLFGAKITGGGMGGDLIVASRISDAQEFTAELRNSLNRAKEHCHSKREAFAQVHFSSTWIEHFPNGYEIEGARIISE